MSTTNSKRIPLPNFWRFMNKQSRRDVLIMIGLPMKHDPVFTYSADNVHNVARKDWDEITNDVQEKIYNLVVKV